MTQTAMYQDVVKSLNSDPKFLPCKYFYDQRGSELFEQITQLNEYYLTRTELKLLEQVKGDIGDLVGKHAQVIEPGSGASVKIKLLFSALDEPASYVPFEISEEILGRASQEIASEYPGVKVQPVSGDFTAPVDIPPPPQALTSQRSGPKVIFFPGSTIGNFAPHEAKALLRHFAALAGNQGALIVGVDTVKETSILEAAYNDDMGITAAFNLNILNRLNRELAADFDIDRGFEHFAYFNTELNRIEMHLRSMRQQRVKLADTWVDFGQGECIHTENSYKYYPNDFIALAEQAGMESLACWTDPDGFFSIHYLQVR